MAPSPAHATDCAPSNRLSSCIDVDNLWPHPGPSRFLSLGGSGLTASGHASFGFVVSFQKQPLVLHLPSADPKGTDVAAVDNQLNANFLWSYGLAPHLELTAAAPVTLYQNGVGIGALTQEQPSPLVRAAVRDIRLGLATALLTKDPMVPGPDIGITTRLEVALPTGDKQVFAGAPGPTIAPSLAADLRQGPVMGAIEAGARFRKIADITGTRIGSQAFLAVGAGVDLLPQELLSFHVEAFSLFTLEPSYVLSLSSGRQVSELRASKVMPAEWLASLRTASALEGDLAIQVGAGTSIPLTAEGATAPLYRAVLSVRYTPVPHEADHDNIGNAPSNTPTSKPKESPPE